jgi:glycosyltransferase involved in cell wall biosynthesis
MRLVGYIGMLKFSLSSFLSFCRRKNVPDVWLIGENLGNSNHDNGFYFFKYAFENYNSKVFFLINKKRKIPEELFYYRNNLLVINSWKHYFYYFKARYCIVSHGIRDAIPEFIVMHKRNYIKPLIYLQHGVIKYKKLPYNRMSYNKSILRFLSSSEDEKKIITTKMMPKKIEHDLAFTKWKLAANDALDLSLSTDKRNKELEFIKSYVFSKGYRDSLENKLKSVEAEVGIEPSRVPVTGLPRYDSLLEDSSKVACQRRILIFPTWREYLVNNDLTSFKNTEFFKSYFDLVTGKEFLLFLKNNNYEAKFLLHTEMLKFSDVFKELESELVSVSGASSDLRTEILKSEILITDYSSMAWEFSILNKKTIFYHFDFEEYLLQRGTYATDTRDWNGPIASTKEALISLLNKQVKDKSYEALKVQQDYGFVASGNACERILKEIETIPPKVYFAVYNIYGFGGTVKTVINTANYLYRKGYDVEIISIRRTLRQPRLGLNPGIKVRPLYDARRRAYTKKKGLLNWTKNLFVRTLRKLPSVLIHRKEELYSMLTLYTDIQLLRHFLTIKDGVLITTIPSLNWLSSKIVSKNVFKIGQEHRTYYDHDKKLTANLFNSYRKLDALTVLTEDDYNNFEKNVPGVNLIVQGNGTFVNDELIEPSYSTKKIVSLGRLVNYKGYDLLVEAFAMAAKDNPEWELEIYGKGIERESLMLRVEELCLNEKVHFFDPVTDIDSVLRSGSIFALPSRVEPFGMVVLEAGANGLPIVSFDIPYGPKSLIDDGGTGLFANSFDVNDYAKKLSILMSDTQLRRDMGHAAHKKILNKYSTDAVGEQFEHLLK